MNDAERTRLDAALDLLADEVAQRLEARRIEASAEPPLPPLARFFAGVQPPDPLAAPVRAAGLALATPRQAEAGPAEAMAPSPEVEERPAEAVQSPPDATDDGPEEVDGGAPIVGENRSYAATLMARLALGLFAIIALINIPLNAQGVALARTIPSSASLVIRNGLLVQETTSEDVWVYRDGAFHWISSLDAFQHYGYRWENVRTVERGFLARFEKGTPISVLLKCNTSPHVYAVESGGKRWIVDLATFQAEGYAWENVRSVDCNYLRRLPDGESIPPGRGTPPPPLP